MTIDKVIKILEEIKELKDINIIDFDLYVHYERDGQRPGSWEVYGDKEGYEIN